jgi:methyl-accepting chemotaxis protein
LPKGDDEKLKWFESSIDIKNTLIEVSSIEKAYFPAGDEFSKFVKVVDDDETDARLDKGVDVMNKMLVGINDINKTLINMNSNLSRKIDNLGEKVDTIGEKIDNLGEKVDTIGEKIDNLGEKVDTIGEKIDRIDGKMGSMLQKQDDLIVVGQRHEFQPE